MTPSLADVVAATPKCPCYRTVGPEAQRCAEVMEWRADRGVWVCHRHPHMYVNPGNLAKAHLSPAPYRPAA